MNLTGITGTTGRAAADIVPACPNCDGRTWVTRQSADCSRHLRLSEHSGQVSSWYGHWEEIDDTHEDGRGGNFTQDDWTCRRCGYVADGTNGAAVQAAFEKEHA